jgi:hypothetical protein
MAGRAAVRVYPPLPQSWPHQQNEPPHKMTSMDNLTRPRSQPAPRAMSPQISVLSGTANMPLNSSRAALKSEQQHPQRQSVAAGARHSLARVHEASPPPFLQAPQQKAWLGMALPQLTQPQQSIITASYHHYSAPRSRSSNPNMHSSAQCSRKMRRSLGSPQQCRWSAMALRPSAACNPQPASAAQNRPRITPGLEKC